MKNSIKKNRINNAWASVIKFTPNFLKKAIKNRVLIVILTLAIGGFIGNRFDRFALTSLKWFVQKKEYYNFIIILLAILIILLVWVTIVFIRLHDYQLYYSDSDGNYTLRQSSDEFYSELTQIITKSKYKHDLYISIGEGESLKDWLVRVFEESESKRINEPQIQNIYIKMLSTSLCKELEKNGFLADGFTYRLNKNINDFINNPVWEEHGINVKILYWNKLPPFHGFVYDKYCLVNSWEITDSSVLHVRTNLKSFTGEDNPQRFNEIKRLFEIE